MRLLKLTPTLLGRGLLCPAMLKIDDIPQGADTQPWFLVFNLCSVSADDIVALQRNHIVMNMAHGHNSVIQIRSKLAYLATWRSSSTLGGKNVTFKSNKDGKGRG